MEYKSSNITGRIIRAARNVHSVLGNGFQELIYQRSLAVEFGLLDIHFGREISISVFYKEVEVGARRVDFLVDQKISVEIRALSKLEPIYLAQAKNYLEAFNLEIGVLINFGANSLEWKRLYNNKYRTK